MKNQLIKRGGKQLIALDIINSFPDDGTFEELSAKVAAQCFSDEIRASEGKEPLPDSEKESHARHLMKYLVKYQREFDKSGGKKKTLQEQGRIILGYVNSLDESHQEPDPENPGKKMTVRHRTFPNAGKAAIILRGPTKRKAPVIRTPEERKQAAEMTTERVAMFRQAAKNLRARDATAKIKEMASAGASQFAKPQVVVESSEASVVPTETEDA